VTPSAFKPAAGFGAFGSAATPPTSPFFKKPDEKPLISAFGSPLLQSASSTTPVSTPTFGSPSVLGGPKSISTPVSPPSPTVLKPMTSTGFGAFSGSMGSGFGAFAGPKKSFSELLKTGDPDPTKPSTPLAFSAPSSKDLPEKAALKVVTPTPSDWSSRKEDDGKDDKQKTPKSIFSSLSAPSPGKEFPDKVEVDEGKATAVPDDGDKKPVSTKLSSGTISDEPSYGIISGSSAASSFVDVKADQDADQESDRDAEEDGEDEGEDGVNEFLSEDASSDGSYEDQESAEESSAAEDSEAQDSPPLEPAVIPLPISRSPSATPQPEVPRIEVSPSPPTVEKSYRSSSLSPAREPSTTPPGTPAKESKPFFSSSPSPTGNTPASPFGIGLGRPSTRPARSSPLANAVLSGHDDDDDDKAKSSQPPEVASKSLPNTFPVKVEGESSEGQSLSDKRPKTPPLLSTMGGTSFFGSSSSSEASKPSTASVENSKVNTPTSLPFGFQKPSAIASLPSVFGNLPQVPNPTPSFMSAIQRPASEPTPTHPTFFGTPPPASATSSSNVFAFSNLPSKPQTSTTTISLASVPQGPAVVKPSVFPPIPKSTSSPSLGLPSPFAAPSQPAPFSQSLMLKAPPAGLFASSPAFSVPQKPPAATSAQVALEEGMQKECIHSVSLAEKELEEVSIPNFSSVVVHIERQLISTRCL
jgi:nucleoporin NUP159